MSHKTKKPVVYDTRDGKMYASAPWKGDDDGKYTEIETPPSPGGGGVQSVTGSLVGGTAENPTVNRPYLVYVALLNQSGTNIPVATELENTLGEVVTYSRQDVGVYRLFVGNLTLDPNKTVVLFTWGLAGNGYIDIDTTTGSYIFLNTNTFTGDGQDGALNNAAIEVRIYP